MDTRKGSSTVDPARLEKISWEKREHGELDGAACSGRSAKRTADKDILSGVELGLACELLGRAARGAARSAGTTETRAKGGGRAGQITLAISVQGKGPLGSVLQTLTPLRAFAGDETRGNTPR